VNSFDTLKIGMSLDCLERIDYQRFDERALVVNEIETSKKFILKREVHLGVNSFEVDRKRGKAILECSAKLLKGRYFEGINQNTIEAALHNFNEYGFATLNIGRVLGIGEVFRCDVTKSFDVSHGPELEISRLALYQANPLFRVELYKDESAVFTSRAKKNPLRLIIYRKYPELLLKKNHRLLSYIEIKETKNMIRSDLNLRTFEHIRKMLEIETHDLKSALGSTAHPITRFFNKIKARFPDTTSFPKSLCHLPFGELKNRIGWEGIIKLCHKDMNELRCFIKSKIKGDVSRYIRQAKPIFFEMMAKDLSPSVPNSFQSEIERKLFAA